ncbi:hypothetical protein OF83DRAFT_1170832, partial [Amylostereum chailletii]
MSRVSLQDPPQPNDVGEYQRSSHPSPCKPGVLLAASALQLELGESETTFNTDHIIVSPFLSPSQSSLSRSSQELLQPPPPAPPPPPPSRVRFRSRVRISGLRHTRTHSLDSSSGSPSSSISVPLESNPRGVLGQRLSMLTPSMWQKRLPAPERARTVPPDERTPIHRAVRRYGEPRNPEVTPEEEDEDTEVRARRGEIVS